MKNYRFEISKSGMFSISFIVTAMSRKEAVTKANQALAEPIEGEPIHIHSPIHDAYLVIDPDMQVDASMIVDETEANLPIPPDTLRYLEEHGFEYSGDEDDLWSDDEPEFIKPIETWDSRLYALLRVRAHYDLNIEDYSFRIKAFLYPTANARIVDGDGGLYYRVEFQDAQLYTTCDELPEILDPYEDKFRSLMFALRDNDPIDGLPL